jgi:pyrroloquinoline quinone (PQQ) biosynthesis protein C
MMFTNRFAQNALQIGDSTVRQYDPGEFEADAVVADLDQAFGLLLLDSERGRRLVNSAACLAQAAFGQGIGEAVATVERTLYRIHCKTAFAPPVQPVAGAVWCELMTAKLRHALVDRVGKSEIEHTELVDRFAAALEQSDVRDHSFIDDVAAEEGMEGLTMYTKNWYTSTDGFTSQLFSIGQRANARGLTAVGNAIIENLNEECEPSAPHQMLRARWLAQLGIVHGIDRTLADSHIVLEAIALQNFRTGVATLSDPSWALGMFYSVEANFPAVCRRMYPTLKKRGYDAQAIALFESHATVDTEHASEWLNALAQTPMSPKERAQALNGGLAQIELRSQMFAAMRRQPRQPMVAGS